MALPEEECAFSLFFLPQQGQRQGLVLTAALMEGLKLWCQLGKLEDETSLSIGFKLQVCFCFTQLELQYERSPAYCKRGNYRLKCNRKWENCVIEGGVRRFKRSRSNNRNCSSPRRSKTPLCPGLGRTGGAAAEASTTAPPGQCHHWSGPTYTAEWELLAANTHYHTQRDKREASA